MSKFTPEEIKRRAERIRQSAPWNRSTGPRTPAGKASTAKNACKVQLSPAAVAFYQHRENPTIIGYLSDFTVPIAERVAYIVGDIAALTGGGTAQLLNELVEILELSGETVSDADITHALRILVEEY